MQTPRYETLRLLAEHPNMPPSLFQGSFLHPNPRFYKYLWWIFWEESPVEGQAFLDSTPLTTQAAFKLMECLHVAGKPYLVYNERLPRRGVTIWNYQSARFKDAKLAPSYEDDPDPATEDGHK